MIHRFSRRRAEGDRLSGLDRLLLFSDAVIAIAMTLLVLDLPVPEAGTPAELLGALAGESARQYIAFLIAFALIGGSWISHHMLMSQVVGSDARLMVLNLISLLGFVLVPWATEAIGSSPGGAGVAVFSAVMALLVGSMTLLEWHIHAAGLLEPAAPVSWRARTLALTGVPTATFIGSIPLAFLMAETVIILWPLAYFAGAIYANRSANLPLDDSR